MIKTVIFDVGNVLVDFDWDGYINKLFPKADKNFIAKINDAVWGGERWQRLDAGDDPEEVFKNIISHAPEYENELRVIFRRVGETLRKRPETPNWIKSLKEKGYQVLYLSNYSHYVMKANPEVLDFLPLMDGGIFSCDVKLIKPQREIYECIAEKYNLNPSECVFIDDLERNIKGAKDFGFEGIQFVTLKQTQEDLNKILERK